MESAPTPSSIEFLPASPPPPGVRPNFVNPVSRAYQIYVAAGVCLPLMLLFAGMRFYAKVFLLKSITKADYACLLGLTAGITYIGITVGVASGGVPGKHQWDFLLEEWSAESLRLGLVNEAIYGPLIWLVKLSLFLMLLELFGLLTWLRVSVWIGIVITGLFYFSHFVATLALCAPRGDQSQLSWLKVLSSSTCQANGALFLPVGIANLVSDIYLILIPLPVIWRLQLPLSKKIGISAIFLTGLMQVAKPLNNSLSWLTIA